MNILREIRDYLQIRQRASLNDIALHFETPPDAIRPMLEQWINKGKVNRCDALKCNGCASSCGAAQEESYEWRS